MKRARDEAEQQQPADEQPPEDPPWERDPDSYVAARDVVKLRFVASASDVLTDAEAPAFTPPFLHQHFANEALALPVSQRPLTIEVLYAAHTLVPFPRCDRPMEGSIEDAMFSLVEQLPQAGASAEALLDAPEVRLGGEVLATYERGGAQFEARLCSFGEEEARRFNENLQSLMRFYIDAHSPIDHTDDRWRLLTIFEEAREGAPRRFTAAATAMVFSRFVAGGIRTVLKVCQVMVAPSHQRQGHGSALLQLLYDHAATQGAVEVTVEDPSAGFRMLRDLVDLRNCRRLGLLQPTEGCESQPLADEARAAARTALRITDEQISRCHEVGCYSLLQRKLAGKEGPEPEATAKPFRLCVKRRLNKKHEETLGALDGAARKAELERLYQALVAEYAVLVARVQEVPTPAGAASGG